MVSPVSDITASVARRIRDDNNTGAAASLVHDLIDRTQIAVNAHRAYVIQKTEFTARRGVALYDVETELDRTVFVVDVRQSDASLERVSPWNNLWKISPTWLTDQAETPRGWATIGATTLVIYPVPSRDVDLTVFGVAQTLPLSVASATLEFRLEDEDTLRDLVTAQLLLRQHDLDEVETLIQRFASKVGLQSPELVPRTPE